MIDLTDMSSLPVQLDEVNCKLVCGENITCRNLMQISLSDISPILLNKFIRYPENVYSHHMGIEDTARSKNGCCYDPELKYDLIVIPFSLLGIEYNRTHIFYSDDCDKKVSSFVEVLHGEVTIIIQKNKEDNDPYAYNTFVEEIDLIRMKAGDRIAIPAGVLYSFVNTGDTHATFAVISSIRLNIINYDILKKEKGLAFYIISKNSRMEIVANPKYRVEEKPKHKFLKNFEDDKKKKYLSELLSDGRKLYDLLMNKQELFSEVLV